MMQSLRFHFHSDNWFCVFQHPRKQTPSASGTLQRRERQAVSHVQSTFCHSYKEVCLPYIAKHSSQLLYAKFRTLLLQNSHTFRSPCNILILIRGPNLTERIKAFVLIWEGFDLQVQILKRPLISSPSLTELFSSFSSQKKEMDFKTQDKGLSYQPFLYLVRSCSKYALCLTLVAVSSLWCLSLHTISRSRNCFMLSWFVRMRKHCQRIIWNAHWDPSKVVCLLLVFCS